MVPKNGSDGFCKQPENLSDFSATSVIDITEIRTLWDAIWILSVVYPVSFPVVIVIIEQNEIMN